MNDVKAQARTLLKAEWSHTVLSLLLLNLILFSSNFWGLLIGFFLIAGGVKASKASVFLGVANNNPVNFDAIYHGFSLLKPLKLYFKYLMVTLLLVLSLFPTLFFWLDAFKYWDVYWDFSSGNSAFFVIAFILIVLYTVFILFSILYYWLKKSYSFLILVDDNNINLNVEAIDALNKKLLHKKMKDLLIFELNFILWRLGSIITFGLLNIYFEPYYRTSKALFYLSLKNDLNR